MWDQHVSTRGDLSDFNSEQLETEINELCLQEMVKFMMVKFPFATGQLLASYINTLLYEGRVFSSLVYAENVNSWPPWFGWGKTKPTVNWSNPATIPHAREAAEDYAQQIIAPATEYVMRAHGLVQ